MGKAKKVKKTLDERIKDLRKQQNDVSRLFDRIQGAIEILESMKEEDDEKTD
mgnify:CR=1 FL=1